MSQIKVSNLTFAYDGSYDNIFTDVSFQIDTDWRLGFCGRNGRGKTTFLNLLMGKYEYSGSITAGAGFEYFPFPVSDDSKTPLEILNEIAPNAEVWQIQRELSMLSINEDTQYRPFSTLSGGERTKALLAGLFLRENSFLLIDEPTNHLDMTGRETVARYMSKKSGFILVSHDRAFLDECTDYTLSINKNNIEVIKGNFSVWMEQKKRQDASELARNERLSREIGRLKESSVRTANWSDKVERSKNQKQKSGLSADRGYIGHKAAKMMKRSKNAENRRQNAIEEKSGLLKNIESAESLAIQPLVYHSENLITLEKVSVLYDGKEAAAGVDFTLKRGDRISLRGGNGSGKSSIIKLICGEDLSYSGKLKIAAGLTLSYVPQDFTFQTGSLSDYAEAREIDETLFKTILRKLGFERVQFEKDIQNYSAGQKKKVLLAQSLCSSAHVYVWDEPLNYIDVMSRMQVEELITAYMPTMLFVEHDRAFCDNVATKVIYM